MSWNIKTPGDYINGPLTVAGSATITGDLTVATDAFKVISATKDVCIGTVTPTFNNKLTVVGGGGGDAFITSGNGTRTGYIGTDGTYVIMGGYSNHTLRIHANDVAQMQIAPLGLFEWYDGAGGTRMTLNSTGLGVGVTASSGGSISNTSQILAGIFSTLIGILPSVATATPTTIFAAPSESTLIVTAYVVGAAPSDYKVVAVVKVGGGVVAITNISTATSITITASGTNIQVTQTSGGSQNVYFNVLRLS
jgi:hypothetical protein